MGPFRQTVYPSSALPQLADRNSRIPICAGCRRSLSSPLTAMTSGTYYLSFLINFGQGFYGDGIEGNDMGYRAVEFWGDAGNFQFNIAYNTYQAAIGPQQQQPQTGRMFFGGFGGDQILEGCAGQFLYKRRYPSRRVAIWLSSTAASDTIAVYLDPTLSDEPVIPSAAASGVEFTLGAIGGVSLFGGSGMFPSLTNCASAPRLSTYYRIFPCQATRTATTSSTSSTTKIFVSI